MGKNEAIEAVGEFMFASRFLGRVPRGLKLYVF